MFIFWKEDPHERKVILDPQRTVTKRNLEEGYEKDHLA